MPIVTKPNQQRFSTREVAKDEQRKRNVRIEAINAEHAKTHKPFKQVLSEIVDELGLRDILENPEKYQ